MIMSAKSIQLCLTLCNPMDCSLPGSSVHKILQARILECVAISFFRPASWLRDWTWITCTDRWSLPFEQPGKPHIVLAAATAAASLQSCPTLCDPTDGSPPGSAIPGILQARTLEWVAISFSNAWKWKVKVKSLSHVLLFATPWTAAYLCPWDFPGKSTGVGCHCLLHILLTYTKFKLKWDNMYCFSKFWMSTSNISGNSKPKQFMGRKKKNPQNLFYVPHFNHKKYFSIALLHFIIKFT